MISIEQIVHVVIYLLVVGGIFWLLNWLIDYCGVSEPFNKFAKVFLAVCAVLLLISLLLGLIGHPIITFTSVPKEVQPPVGGKGEAFPLLWMIPFLG